MLFYTALCECRPELGDVVCTVLLHATPRAGCTSELGLALLDIVCFWKGSWKDMAVHIKKTQFFVPI